MEEIHNATIKNFNDQNGWGFVTSEELVAKYGCHFGTKPGLGGFPQMSSVQNSGCLGYIGDYTLLYGDSNMPIERSL